MKFKGKVEDIVFRNEENGYTVLNFDADGNLITAVGIFPIVAEGENLEITGEFKTNSRFGEQFLVSEVTLSKPDDVMGIFKYLSSGLFKGIGEKLAWEIVKYFGVSALDVLENTPNELRKVNGIGKKKLAEIIESYKATKDMKEAILFLQKYDIAMGTALKIYKKYESNTKSIVSHNPYRLVDDIDGIGFVTADKIAKKLGIDSHSEFRIRSGIVYTLLEAAIKGGHTCLIKNELIKEASKLLELEEEEVSYILDNMEEIKTHVIADEVFVASQLNYNTENAIATKLIRLNMTAEKWNIDIDAELVDYQQVNKIALDENQTDGIKGVFNNGVSVITGGPGTGKTTIIKGITTILGQRKKKVLLCAPTGRASKRMTEATGEEAKTIHRLLGSDFSADRKFEKNETNPLEADIVIVDEISMADIYIFYALLKAIPCGARLVLVGDKDQLPSVSCGNILSDIIGSDLIKVVYLTNIYRQASGSMIVSNAHRVNKGEMPIFKGATDFFMSNKNDNYGILSDVLSMTNERIPNFAKVSTKDIQVLAPMKKGIVGVDNLNIELQKIINPVGKEHFYQGTIFRVGDKVMQNVNNYTITWIKDWNKESGSGVFNGDIGYIIFADEKGVKVEFDDGKIVEYKGGDVEQLMLAYCISVHKSQGSEFPVVVLVVNGGNYMILTRNLLYTAITRAKKMVVIIGDEDSLKKMVSNNFTVKRYSLLKEFLQRNKNRIEMLWGKDED